MQVFIYNKQQPKPTQKFLSHRLLSQSNKMSSSKRFSLKSMISSSSSSSSHRQTSLASNEDIQREEQQLRASDPDLQDESLVVGEPKGASLGKCPFTGQHDSNGEASAPDDEPLPFQYVPLRMGGNGGTHKPSEGSRALIENEVSLQDLKSMTNKFYELAFQDATLDKFIRSHSDPHGDRFAKWIHQKLSGSNVWDRDRRTRDLTPHELAGGRGTHVVHDRSSAHVAAWYSPKRPQREVGRHFQLDECRVWMRIHFWAMRESGIVEKSPSFADYYVRFIGHFVAVYERSATAFARESFRWSANPKNIERYIKNGRRMDDVLGLRFSSSLNSLTDEDRYDDEWPYHQVQ